ncbi:uncharacterized protein LOC123034708 [Varanus komodoensis]|uniref:uncharacterized protein LOC123034708 n=1 Tax=Varanus komodoensis TaxID=61221 RepID=UPI001CF7DC93|nr:uncharacterized protein LOC123034708 [Varanus komodoensis]
MVDMWVLRFTFLGALLPLSLCECKTRWFNRDSPSGVGDYELLSYLRDANPEAICPEPTAIEVQTVDGVPASKTGQTFFLNSAALGFVCLNTQQGKGERCHNYQVRFSCPPSFCSPTQTPQSEPEQTTCAESQEGAPSPQAPISPKATPPPAQTPPPKPEETTSAESRKGGPTPQVPAGPETTLPPVQTRQPGLEETTIRKGAPTPQAQERPETTLSQPQTPQPEPETTTAQKGGMKAESKGSKEVLFWHLQTAAVAPSTHIHPRCDLNLTSSPSPQDPPPRPPLDQRQPSPQPRRLTPSQKRPPLRREDPHLRAQSGQKQPSPQRGPPSLNQKRPPRRREDPRLRSPSGQRQPSPERGHPNPSWRRPPLRREDPLLRLQWDRRPPSPQPRRLSLSRKRPPLRREVPVGPETTFPPVQTPQPEPQETTCAEDQKGGPTPQPQVRPETTFPAAWTPQPEPEETTSAEGPKGVPTPQASVRPETTLPLAQTLQPGPELTTSADSQKGVCWTRWFDQDNPEGTGDLELLEDIVDNHLDETCSQPMGIEVQTLDGTPASKTGQQFSVNDAILGFACINAFQEKGQRCHDYRVRFTCPPSFCCGQVQTRKEPTIIVSTDSVPVQTTLKTPIPVCKTKWINRDNPKETGDIELLYYIRKNYPSAVCKRPIAIEVQTVDGIPADQTGQQFYRNDVVHGFACVNAHQGKGVSCRDYKVRFTCTGSFCTGLAEMYHEELLCDVTLITEGQSFPCHRALLAAISPYFRDIFISTWEESNGKEVQLLDVAPSTVQSILKYIYTEEIALMPDSVQCLFVAASKLQIIPLQKLCCRFLLKNLSLQNWFEMHNLAQSHKNRALLHAVTQLLIGNFERVIEEGEFLQLEPSTFISLIASSDLAVASELTVYQTVRRWVQAEPSERRPLLLQLMSYVRLSLLTLEEQEELQKDLEQRKDLRLEWKRLDGRERLLQTRGLRQGMYKPHILCIDTQLCEFPELERGEVHMGCYDPEDELWEKLPGLPFLTHACCASAADKIYISGGAYRNSYSTAVYEFSFFNGKWLQLPSMDTPRAAHGFLCHNEKLFAMGGWCKFQTFLTSAECFDFGKQTWAAIAKLPFALSHPATSVFREKLYLFGGATGISSSWLFHRGFLIYEVNSNSWTQVPLATGFFSAGAVAVENGIYVIGGYSEKKTRDWVDGALLPENRHSSRKCFFVNEGGKVSHGTTIPKLPRGVANAGVAYCGKRIYVLGGEDLTQRYKTIYHWEPGETRWHRSATEIPVPREGISRFGCSALLRPRQHILQLFQCTSLAPVAAISN